MKTTYFENMRNKEKFFSKDLNDIQMIDGDRFGMEDQQRIG